MRVAILGEGAVGRVLAAQWKRAGHEVRFGVRRSDAATRVEGVPVSTVAQAIEGADVVVLAIPWSACADVVRALAPSLEGTVLLDCTNPVSGDLTSLVNPPGVSGASLIAEWAPTARVVKALNTSGSERLDRPVFNGVAATMPYCGDDASAKSVVHSLIGDLGFEPLDCGSLEAATLLEGLAFLWIRLAHLEGLGPDIGFKLLRE